MGPGLVQELEVEGLGLQGLMGSGFAGSDLWLKALRHRPLWQAESAGLLPRQALQPTPGIPLWLAKK